MIESEFEAALIPVYQLPKPTPDGVRTLITNKIDGSRYATSATPEDIAVLPVWRRLYALVAQGTVSLTNITADERKELANARDR